MAFHRRWFLILFALVLSGESLFAAGSTREQRDYAAAVAPFHDGLWSYAATNLIQFIRKYPDSTNAPEAVLLLAQAEYQQGDFPGAIATLNKHREQAGNLADRYVYWTGEAQSASSNFLEAAATLISIPRDFPQSPLRLTSVVEAAATYAKLADWREHDALLEDTNGVFQQAAQLEPGNKLVVDGRLSLENSKYQQRDFPGVVAAYELLTNQWQTLNQVQQCQGAYLFYLAKMGLGDYPAALAAATNLVQVASSPANQDWLATGWASQGAALKQMGRLPDAVQAWQNNLTNAPVEQKREAILEIAELEFVHGDLTNAGQALANFLAQFPDAITADIALLTAGELRLKNYAGQAATNQLSATDPLSAARDSFDQFIAVFTNSQWKGRAYLDRGWCGWLAGNMTNSLADFSAAAQSPDLPPEDLAVAWFKMGDAQFALTNYEGAMENYRMVPNDDSNSPAVAGTLGDRALYQMLRANLQLTNMAGASNALAQILERYPSSDWTTNSALLYGEGLAEARQPADSREQFQKFLALFPDAQLRQQVEFAVARSYELEQNWTAAIAGYQVWLEHFPTNDLRSQTIYALARANAQAGNETNAFGLFTNFVAQFPTNDLAPLAQYWVAEHFFRLGGANFADAEKNYELVYINYPTNDLAWPARMMAGRAAVARQDYDGAIKNYFKPLEADTNCPADLQAQALFAHGSALMFMDSTNPLVNVQSATNVFNRICQLYATNQLCAQAWIETGNCDLQLAAYGSATNAYAQVFSTNSPVGAAAGVAPRSEAQIGFGIALEKMAALVTGTNQAALVQIAFRNYYDVLYGNNLRPDELQSPFWTKKAGLQAVATAESLGDWGQVTNVCAQLKIWLPQLSDSLDKKIAGANAHLSQKNN